MNKPWYPKDRKLFDATVLLKEARSHVAASAFLAGGMSTSDVADAIYAVADTARRKIKDALALLANYRESGDAPVPVPAAPGAKPKSPEAQTKRNSK